MTAILKWIPVEVIGAYKVAIGLSYDHPVFGLWLSVLTVPTCGLWIAFATKPKLGTIAWRQALLAPLAFAGWAVAMGTDLIKAEVYQAWTPSMGAAVLVAGTILLPILDGILKAIGVPQN
jgi:hypothetical protein